MKTILLIIFMLFICFNHSYPQANSEIKVGDSRTHVLELINSDLLHDCYNVAIHGNKITTSVKASSGMTDAAIEEYYFDKRGILQEEVLISRAVDLDGMMRLVYQANTENHGEPAIVMFRGHKAYHWNAPDEIGYKYFYKAYSDWYQEECLFAVVTIKPIKSK